MRRGHAGVSGWRNDNPRHYRPRGGGTPHFRPTRGFGHADAPRFQSPGPRPLLGPALYPNSAPGNDMHFDHHDMHGYRGNRIQRRPPDRGPYPHPENRQIYPVLQRMRHGDIPDHISFQDPPYYFDNNQQPWDSMNSMGDIDHHQPMPSRRRSPWGNRSFSYEDRSPTKAYRCQDNAEHIKTPQPGYTGHRPPASDHYGGNHGSTMENSNTFSRSVDDTVDIVRKRLLNRESQPLSESPPLSQTESEKSREPVSNKYSNVQHDQPIKKKSFKSRNIKLNCDKIKNKIVHQLFMMDKDKIHKLMDNPNSSSKFEYAISSLVTESQNSFNRHLRSVAEKSLCSSNSSEFINDDNNTIYEDTFMKQMEGLLDPQDTVLLEDIKPMVLAELRKVLQLDDLQEIEETAYSRDGQPIYDEFSNECYERYNTPAENENYYEEKPVAFERSQSPRFGNQSNIDVSKNESDFDPKPLFERRQARKSRECSLNRRSSEERRRKERKSVEGRQEENLRICGTPIPLFDSNTEHLSDDEDPFAELDRQYHVAVDHNFIENEYMPSPPSSTRSNIAQSPKVDKETPNIVYASEKPACRIKPPTQLNIKTPENQPANIKEEIEFQLLDMAKSPLKFLSPTFKNDSVTPVKNPETDVIQETSVDSNSNNTATIKKHRMSVEEKVNVSINQDHSSEPPVADVTPEKSECSTFVKSSTQTDSRKRSIDMKPSHRKEKRKKSETGQQDSNNKQILNKNIIIHVSDCAAKTSDKSIFNLYFSKENGAKELSKDIKKNDSSDKKYSDKYVKRKEKESINLKKSKDKDVETKKRHDSSSTSHSIVSPTDISNTSSGHTATKVDVQTKLKPIDMFVELSKKPNVHQAHRNTAAPVTTPSKITPVELKPVVISRKITKRHIATQVVRKCLSKEIQTEESKCSTSRFCQTERKKSSTRGSQTEPVSFKPASKSTDAFERMKEIDMEIQALLQEKFKLYNSLESKESSTNTMQSLGMAVLNVTPDEPNEIDNCIAEDVIEEFTNIPVEELESIALETVQEEQIQKSTTPPPTTEKPIQQQKTQGQKKKRRDSSISTNTSTNSTRKTKSSKAPNISLIEQIITDDRPLEDIISLDELESSPSKKKSQKVQTKPKKKYVKKKPLRPVHNTVCNYDIKECSVQLKREDISKLLLKLKKGVKVSSSVSNSETTAIVSKPESGNTNTLVESTSLVDKLRFEIDDVLTTQTVLEEVINDLQFDMLDVSEDIEIGDVCEEKCDKEVDDASSAAVNDEIILDNSQSSMDDGTASEGSGECKTYDYSTDEKLRRDSITVTGNGDAVLAIECIENNFIAACLDGNVYYFSGDGKLLSTLRGSNLAVTCLTIVKEKYETTVYTGSLDSRIRYYDLDTGMEKGPECNVLSPIQTMDRAWDTVFVGTRTGFVLQFECKNNMLIPVSTVKFSDQSILALRAMKEGPRKVLLVAARSEQVTIKDAQTGLLLRTLEGPKMTVYTLLFEDGKVYCGTSSQQIHVFDYASGSHMGSHSGGKGAVCLRAGGGLVFAGCYDGCVYVYRDGTPAPLAQLRGPSLMLLSLAVVGTKIIAGYKDRSLYIWKIPLAVLKEMIL